MAEKTDKASDQDPTDSTDSEMDETDIDLRTRHCHDCDIVPPNNAACESGVRNTKMDTIRGATATLPCLKSECDDDNSESGFKTRTRSLTFRRKKSEKPKEINKKRKNFWSFRLKSKLPGRFRRGTDHGLPDQKPVDQSDANSCVCTGYRRTENDGKSTNSTDHTLSNTAEVPRRRQNEQLSELARMLNVLIPPPVRVPVGTMESVLALTNLDLTGDEFPIEDIETIMMRRRAHEIEHGIDATPRAHYPHFGAANRRPSHSNSAVCQAEGNSPPHLHVSRDSETHIVHFDADLAVASIREALQKQCTVGSTPSFPSASTTPLPRPVPTRQLCVGESHHRYDEFDDFSPIATFTPQQPVHTQVDYVHCLVPDLKDIVKCSFYWGVMDRYEAERLLENKPEGTFLLRDSAQEEFLFSVSFRRYGRSLHARIEQWNHKFSFDSHDPGVYAADSVCGLIEHYKDPSCCMFFEPMLTIPLNRNFPFSLQQSCRGVICTHTTYDGINLLPLPKSLKKNLKYYHYKQKIRVRRFEVNQ